MEVLELLRRSRDSGLTVWADGYTLCVKGSRRLESLVRELQARKAEVLAALNDESKPQDSFTQAVLDAFDGDPVEPNESCSFDPEVAAPGTPPVRACNGCKRREYHKVHGGSEWVCDKCHPGPGPEGWIATWVAPEPSIHESMNRRRKLVERMDIRGLGKKWRRPTSWNGGQ